MRFRYYPATLLQLLLPLLLLWLLRFPFTLHNLEALGSPPFGTVMRLSLLGLQFDLCAWAWLNAPFILLRFLPFSFTQRRGYLLTTNIIYFILNLCLLLPAVADIPFFQFNGAHLRWQSLATIWSDPNMGGIVASFFSDYWMWFLLALVVIVVVGLSAFRIIPSGTPFRRLPLPRVFLFRLLIFLGAAGATFLCIRGHMRPGRPLSIGDAIWGISESRQANIVLNTPFCIIRTMHNDVRLPELRFFPDERLTAIRNSIHLPADSLPERRRNIVVITIESGSSIWIDRLNPVKGESLGNLMPFLDSMIDRSVVFPNAFTTGIRSIEGVTGVYGGVPTFGDMILMTSPYFTNTFDAPATLLRGEGYAHRFYFGGNHGSFNIDQTLKTFGFDEIVMREEYGNDADFDGQWGIWDHKMAEYAVKDLSTLPQPFIAGWFTLNPHGPFEVPADWETEGYKSTDDMRRVVEYEDRALRHFFELAEKTDWYDDTVFIIVGDHGCRDLKDTVYDSPGVLPHILMMVFAPDGSIQPQVVAERYVCQYDIAPTVLTLAGYPKEYVALGSDILSPSHPGYALMYIKGAYQVYGPKYVVRLSDDLRKIEGVFESGSDFEMRRPLADYDKGEVARMIDFARAFMQDYTVRLNSDGLGSMR